MQTESSTLRDLFDAAHEMHGAERESFLAGVEAAKRTHLERLLAAADDDSGRSPLDLDPAALIDALDEPPAPPLPVTGQQVGSWVLIDLIGEGGSSTVFRATREHAGVRQEAALKLLRRGLYTVEAQRQFRRERQALVQLRHPGIARLIEGGITEFGLAYIAIELVEGLPITEHARSQGLELRARLGLFLAVCRAVEAAHRALIVHRDLKPSNVLVGADQQIKLLDFGIAKLLDAEDETRTQHLAFTPAYAAPEQRSGGPITVATDVYALGVLFGELVTGLRSKEGNGRTPSSRISGDSDPALLPAPASALRRALRGDLDNIALKATESDPERRYASATALADDIERYLDGRPVLAHPPSRWYRAHKFVQRHRVGAAGTSIFLLALFAALGTALWQANVARNEAKRAAEVQYFLESLFVPLQEGTSPAQAPTVQELLQRGVTRVNQGFARDPRARAEILALFARINAAVGEVRGNIDLARAAWRASRDAYGATDRRTLQAQVVYARALRDAGSPDVAASELDTVLAAMRERSIRGLDFANALSLMALTREDLGLYAEALTFRAESLQERERDPDASADDLATGHNGLGVVYEKLHDYPRALEHHRKAYELHQASKGDSLATATSLANIGNTLSWMGRWHEAVKTIEPARAMYSGIGIERHPNLLALLIRLCDLRGQLESEGAQAVCDQAVSMAEDLFGTSHPQYATALMRRAQVKVTAGDPTATDDYARVRDIFSAAEGDASGRLAMAAGSESSLLYLREDYPGLREMLQEIATGKVPAGAPSTSRSYAWFALACLRAPGPGCSSSTLGNAEHALADPLYSQTPYQLSARIALAEIDLAHADPRGAIARVEAGLATALPELGPRHSIVGLAYQLLARAREQLGEADQARVEHARADAIIAALPATHPLRTRSKPVR
jgi:tetratricopeptide (TPR) repeat protein